MSRWEDQVSNHEINENLEKLQEFLSGEVQTHDENELFERRRLEKIVTSFQTALSSVDPEMAPINQLNDLSNYLNQQQVIQNARKYYNDGDVNGLKQVNNHLTQKLDVLGTLQAISGKLDFQPRLSNLEAQVDQLGSKVQGLGEESDDVFEELQDRKRKLEKSIEEIESKISENHREVNENITQWQKQFSDAQENRVSEFASWKSSIDAEAREKVENLLSEEKDKLEKANADHEEKLHSYIEEADKKHQDIRELHQLAAEDSVAGGYVSNAKREGKSARNWRIASVVFIIAAAAWLFGSFVFGEGATSWRSLLMSFSLTGVLLSGAAYCAQQSTRHRNVEVHNRKFALEMAAIDPYLQSLGEDDQKSLKKELTKRFFGQDIEENNSSIVDEHVTKRVLESVNQNIIKPVIDLSKMANK